MNPIYKFELNINGTQQQAFPDYQESLSKDYALESQEQFYRAKLNGELIFKGNDFARIVSAAFDTEFILIISISYDYGATWAEYWRGSFWKTDCKFDEDSGTARVNPGTKDRYTDVLAGLDKEYNLIDLTPEISPVKADKRPLIQIYVPGESVVSCFLSGMWWEQECEAVTNTSLLTGTYHFGLKDDYRVVECLGNTYPPLPTAFIGSRPAMINQSYTLINGNYTFSYAISTYGSNRYQKIYSIYESSILCWQATIISNTATIVPETVYLEPVGSASGTVQLNIKDVSIYGRLITDVSSFGNVSFPTIPTDDIVPNNRNYHYVTPFTQFDIAISGELWTVPTQWGLYQPGKYYQFPDFNHNYYPVARTTWGATSLWIVDGYYVAETTYRKQFTIRDAYPLASVISVLLGQIAPGISHADTVGYSQFLYGTNPLNGLTLTPIITPKSNVIFTNYDQPAQKAMITLRQVLDMLRDCFRCYWFIDEQSRFRIEHISYFMRGGSYSTAQAVGIDLTTETVPRNGKAWDFGRNQYEFDKMEMPERYQFGWMDEATQLFEGYPIEIISGFVEQGNIQNIQIGHFSSDIDYILLQPGEISREGFVLMQADYINSEYVLPYYQIGVNQELQNGYVAFVYLQSYYAYDMPARSYKINGATMTAAGVKKLKKQTLRFPVIMEPDLYHLIKTKIGNGMIEKMSVNLCSRTANTTLKYDTE